MNLVRIPNADQVRLSRLPASSAGHNLPLTRQTQTRDIEPNSEFIPSPA